MVEWLSAPEAMARIRETDTRLELLLARLSVEQMNQPGAVGVWSVKDVLAHIAFWQRYIIDILAAIARGETPVLDADDETERINASVVAQFYLRPLSAVLADWRDSSEDLLDHLQRISDADLNDPDRFAWSPGRTLLDRIAGNSYDHTQEHIDQIQMWMHTVKS